MAAASVAAVATPAAPITMPVSCSLLSETLGTSTAIWTEPALPSARLATAIRSVKGCDGSSIASLTSTVIGP